MEEEFDEVVSPNAFGLIKIPIPVPPNLEMAFGYPGSERYVAFHECYASMLGFFVEDGDHNWPGVAAGWSLFCKHPAVAKILEALRLDLRRAVPVMSWEQWVGLTPELRAEYWRKTRCLVLDRQERELYVSTQSNARMFLILELASRAPDDDITDENSDDEFDAMLQALRREEGRPLNNERKLASELPVEIDRSVLEHLRNWLDDNEPMERDFAPAPLESCAFRCTNIDLESGQIEEAFGYAGGKRYVSLHWSPKRNKVFVCDGIGRYSLSDAVQTWEQFLSHDLIKPHLQVRDENDGRVVQVDFSAHIENLVDSVLFLTQQSAYDMEADVTTHCLLYDRANKRVYTGRWTSALLFHSLVDDLLEEDMVACSRPKPAPLIDWLNERRDDPMHVSGVAASHYSHGQKEDALAALRRCIEREPDSHLYWFRLSQTLGSVRQWKEALEACDKAVALHAAAPRQYVSAGQLFKWKGQCLFWLTRYSEAADIYRFVIQIDDFAHQADSYSQLARCYERLGNYKEAVDARELQVRDRADSFSQALKARDLDEVEDDIVQSERFFLSQAWFDLGRCHVLAANLGAAEWALRRATEVNSDSIRAHAEFGALLRRLDRDDEAEEQFEHAFALAHRNVARSPDSGSAQSDMAFVYRAMRKDVAAAEADQRAAALGWADIEEHRRVVSLEIPIRAVQPQ